MVFYRALLGSLFILTLTVQADETAWTGALKDGSRIVIDPVTNKVDRIANGEKSLLWDGVHQLDNGAVIIVRNGIVVKDQAILRIQLEQERKQLEEACGRLVRKVCGPRNECRDHPACDPAKQLLAMEQEELQNTLSDVTPESSKQCFRVMHNESFFKPCTKRGADTPLSPCEQLHLRVCGENDQCADTEACNAAAQLVNMEIKDRYSAPSDPAQASRQCSDVLKDKGFFKPCQSPDPAAAR